MPTLKTYDLFISHSWTYSDDYNRLVQLLTQYPFFTWRNYSVPRPKGFEFMLAPRLEDELRGQIRPVNAVLVLAGLWVPHSSWIQREIEIAQQMKKPIIGLKPWGNQRLPIAVQDAANAIVGWNSDSIITAIRTHAI